MNARRHFRRGQSTFTCRHCTRLTRDTGDNGSAELCPECYEGCMQENGYLDTSDPEEKEQYRQDMVACFNAAVAKGGVIEGYPTETITQEELDAWVPEEADAWKAADDKLMGRAA